jgi:hypothetical protein
VITVTCELLGGRYNILQGIALAFTDKAGKTTKILGHRKLKPMAIQNWVSLRHSCDTHMFKHSNNPELKCEKDTFSIFLRANT